MGFESWSLAPSFFILVTPWPSRQIFTRNLFRSKFNFCPIFYVRDDRIDWVLPKDIKNERKKVASVDQPLPV